jgi:hypothetical protein
MERLAPECPYCGTPMEAGVADVRGGLLGLLFFGLGRQHFWFRRHRHPPELREP